MPVLFYFATMAVSVFTDQMNRVVEIPFLPQRIISLVPSQTELLFDLGLEEKIVGLTRFCIHPKGKVKFKTIVGGTKQFDFKKIKALSPDLILGNKEENYAEGILELEKHFPVWMSDVYTLEDSFAMINAIGALTGTQEEATRIISQIVFPPVAAREPYTAAYFIWRKPYMVAAGNTFINNMLSHFGVTNVFADKVRYPEVSVREMGAVKPHFVFLSSEPYSFREVHLAEFRELFPGSEVVLVDGEMFSWYGSRLRLAPAYFQNLRSQLKMG
jgi:ABC-type Fe3+-hydroxamate transport system substrate-binding protein